MSNRDGGSRRHAADPRAASRALILVVQDDADVRALLAELLSEAGYEVTAAADGHEALRLATDHPPDAVVLDLLLPGPTGWEIAPRLHALARRRVPIVVTTAVSPSLFRLPPDVTCVVPKPFDPDAVVRAISGALRAAHGAPTARAE